MDGDNPGCDPKTPARVIDSFRDLTQPMSDRKHWVTPNAPAPSPNSLPTPSAVMAAANPAAPWPSSNSGPSPLRPPSGALSPLRPNVDVSSVTSKAISPTVEAARPLPDATPPTATPAGSGRPVAPLRDDYSLLNPAVLLRPQQLRFHDTSAVLQGIQRQLDGIAASNDTVQVNQTVLEALQREVHHMRRHNQALEAAVSGVAPTPATPSVVTPTPRAVRPGDMSDHELTLSLCREQDQLVALKGELQDLLTTFGGTVPAGLSCTPLTAAATPGSAVLGEAPVRHSMAWYAQGLAAVRQDCRVLRAQACLARDDMQSLFKSVIEAIGTLSEKCVDAEASTLPATNPFSSFTYTLLTHWLMGAQAVNLANLALYPPSLPLAEREVAEMALFRLGTPARVLAAHNLALPGGLHSTDLSSPAVATSHLQVAPPPSFDTTYWRAGQLFGAGSWFSWNSNIVMSSPASAHSFQVQTHTQTQTLEFDVPSSELHKSQARPSTSVPSIDLLTDPAVAALQTRLDTALHAVNNSTTSSSTSSSTAPSTNAVHSSATHGSVSAVGQMARRLDQEDKTIFELQTKLAKVKEEQQGKQTLVEDLQRELDSVLSTYRLEMKEMNGVLRQRDTELTKMSRQIGSGGRPHGLPPATPPRGSVPRLAQVAPQASSSSTSGASTPVLRRSTSGPTGASVCAVSASPVTRLQGPDTPPGRDDALVLP
eukprot:gene5418-964_t